MRRTLGLAAMGICLLGALPAALADDKEKDKDKETESIAWAKSLAAAKDQARRDKTLIMVDFYTDWCGWCKKLDADTYTDPMVIRQSRQMVALKLDAEDKGEGQKAAEAYKVHGYPTILFLDPAEIDAQAGGVVGKIGGYMPPEPFAEQMRQVQQSAREFPKLRDRLAESPDDVEVLGKLAAIYHQRGDDKKAAELLERGEKADPDNGQGHLTKAYNAVADSYQEDRDFARAIPLFRKAAETGKQPGDIAYARSSIAVCYLSQGKAVEAIPEAEAIINLPGVSKADKEQAERLLEMAKQLRDQSPKRDADRTQDKDKDK
jgi:thioredoxin-like negative regulator of GroEL